MDTKWARSIRQRPWGQTAFIIALTGWGQEEDRRRSGEAGFNRHFVKHPWIQDSSKNFSLSQAPMFRLTEIAPIMKGRIRRKWLSG